MWSAIIHSEPLPRVEFDALLDSIDGLCAGLADRGYALRYGCVTIRRDQQFMTFLLIPAQDSLARAASDPVLRSAWEQIDSKTRGPQRIEVVGVSPDFAPACDCPDPPAYVVSTERGVTDESPIRCADTFQPVPLHNLPPLEAGDYRELFSWQRQYQSVEKLWYASSIEETAMYRQMSRPRSALSRLGISVCREYELLVGKPFYYALARFEEPEGTTCLSCKRSLQPFQYRDGWLACDPCRLVFEDDLAANLPC